MNMRHLIKLTLAASFLLCITSSVQSTVLQHERLRIRNTFKTPEEVVAYYCARDASGFIWSGLLDSERTAFTAWNEAPQQDTFYIAKNYAVSPSEIVAHEKDHVSVAVKYSLLGIGDGHGTRMPSPRADLNVVFDVKKMGGVWKIVKPDPQEIAPVVLEAKLSK